MDKEFYTLLSSDPRSRNSLFHRSRAYLKGWNLGQLYQRFQDSRIILYMTLYCNDHRELQVNVFPLVATCENPSQSSFRERCIWLQQTMQVRSGDCVKFSDSSHSRYLKACPKPRSEAGLVWKIMTLRRHLLSKHREFTVFMSHHSNNMPN